MNEKAKTIAKHPATIGGGTVGGVLGIYLLLWQTGVFQHLPGTATEQTAEKVLSEIRELEPRIRANEVELSHKADEDRLTRVEVILSNVATLQAERLDREADLIGEIRTLVATIQEDQ